MEKVYAVVNSSRTLENVPVNFNFVTNRVSAIISNVSYGEKFINSIIMQLATLHSCQDLKLVFLINDDEDNYDWEYAKYLPHVFSDDKQKIIFNLLHRDYFQFFLDDAKRFLKKNERYPFGMPLIKI